MTDAEALTASAIGDCITTQKELLDPSRLRAIADAAQLIAGALSRGRKLLLFGNGGSASDSAHLAAEFVGRFESDRRALPALSLASNNSAVTAIANDTGFDQIFARQVEALGQPGDVAIAISTSGRSPNVLAGVQAARRQGLGIIGLTGSDGGDLVEAVDICLQIPSRNTARIQESHILVGHVLCQLVEHRLG